jgi:hypothetical protein
MADTPTDDGELLLISLLRNPIRTMDSALRTGAAAVPAVLDALRALPRIAGALEKLVPALQAAQGSLDRIDRLSTFVAQELPETQHQLEELRKQILALTGVNRALTESIRLLSRGIGVVHSTTDVLGGLLPRPPASPGSPRSG